MSFFEELRAAGEGANRAGVPTLLGCAVRLPSDWMGGLTSTSDAQGTFGALGHGNEENCEAPVLVKQLWAVGIVMVGRVGPVGDYPALCEGEGFKIPDLEF